MNKIKLLKEYTYMDICDIEFIVLVYFDNDNEVLLYSLKYIDNNYNSSEYLVEYEPYFNEEKIYNVIKTFMLDYLASQISCYIEKNVYNGWKVVAVKNGLKLTNEKTHQREEWNIHDFDEDFEDFQNEIKEFLDCNKGA